MGIRVHPPQVRPHLNVTTSAKTISKQDHIPSYLQLGFQHFFLWDILQPESSPSASDV